LRFLGIDPGLVNTGFAVLEDKRIIVSGVIRRPGSTIDRIHAISREIHTKLEEYQPGYTAIETAFYGKNPKSLIKSAQLIGAILYILREKNSRIIQLHPNTLKRIITGNGRASKEQVIYMVKNILQIEKDLKPDEADAIAIALAASLHYDSRD